MGLKSNRIEPHCGDCAICRDSPQFPKGAFLSKQVINAHPGCGKRCAPPCITTRSSLIPTSHPFLSSPAPFHPFFPLSFLSFLPFPLSTLSPLCPLPRNSPSFPCLPSAVCPPPLADTCIYGIQKYFSAMLKPHSTGCLQSLLLLQPSWNSPHLGSSILTSIISSKSPCRFARCQTSVLLFSHPSLYLLPPSLHHHLPPLSISSSLNSSSISCSFFEHDQRVLSTNLTLYMDMYICAS